MKSMHVKIVASIFFFMFLLHAGFAQKSKNKTKTSSKYEIQGPYYDGLARVKLNHKWGFIDTTGGVVVPLKYNEVSNFTDGLAKVRMGHKWGLVDTKGTVIIKPTFDAIFEFVNGKAKVLLEGKEYYMDKTGTRVPK
jgi:WG containing repeat